MNDFNLIAIKFFGQKHGFVFTPVISQDGNVLVEHRNKHGERSAFVVPKASIPQILLAMHNQQKG